MIKETKTGKLYYIHTSGVVGVVYKNGKEVLLRGALFHNKDLVIKIEGKQMKVKNLVAREVFNGYVEGVHSVVLKDGNPRNCDCYNMRIYTKQELGRATGSKSKKSQPVIIDGVKYSSVRAAAKELFVSYQTILDYLSNKYKKSVLGGKHIKTENNNEKYRSL